VSIFPEVLKTPANDKLGHGDANREQPDGTDGAGDDDGRFCKLEREHYCKEAFHRDASQCQDARGDRHH